MHRLLLLIIIFNGFIYEALLLPYYYHIISEAYLPYCFYRMNKVGNGYYLFVIFKGPFTTLCQCNRVKVCNNHLSLWFQNTAPCRKCFFYIFYVGYGKR